VPSAVVRGARLQLVVMDIQHPTQQHQTQQQQQQQHRNVISRNCENGNAATQ
jgi:hypothetical protein